MHTVTPAQVRSLVREAIARGGAHAPEIVNEFLALLDRSHREAPHPTTHAMVSKLEDAAAADEDGRLSLRSFERRLATIALML